MEKSSIELDLIEVTANLRAISVWLGASSKRSQHSCEVDLYSILVPLYIASDKLNHYNTNVIKYNQR